VFVGCMAGCLSGGTAGELEDAAAWHVTEASLVLCVDYMHRTLNALHALYFGCFLFR
jgi:hypothetical protein